MPIETHLKLCLLALTLLLAGISAQAPQPDDFYGPDAPYAINQSDPSANDVSADNRRATFLYGYNKCIEFYGDNAKAQIDEAYLDAYYMSKWVKVIQSIRSHESVSMLGFTRVYEIMIFPRWLARTPELTAAVRTA